MIIEAVFEKIELKHKVLLGAAAPTLPRGSGLL
jgi:3-hydroxyacyl-CoA dehydrogenase